MRTPGLLIAAALLAGTAGWAQSKPSATPPRTTTIERDVSRLLFRSNEDATRVSVELDNARIGEALKKVLESANREYVLEPDLPEEPRVSLKVRNVRLSTALDLLTEGIGAGWRTEVRDGKPTIRVGKNIQPGFGAISLPLGGDLLRHGIVTAPDITAFVPNQNSKLHGFFYGISEERSTFTCPHCKGQTTQLRQRQQPKCTKCQRAFQSDWQFCPADGAKRPAAPNQWKFCPHCGKDVKTEKSDRSENGTGPDAAAQFPGSVGSKF